MRKDLCVSGAEKQADQEIQIIYNIHNWYTGKRLGIKTLMARAS